MLDSSRDMTALVEAAAAGALHTAELADHHCTA
jgi:hypothetical protein